MKFLLFALIFVFLFIGFALFDVVNRYQYKYHREEWERYGKAGGFFWFPEESTFFRSSIERSVRMLSWTFGAEKWMKDVPSIYRALILMRICFYTTWILMVALLILAFGT
jgi:hypothetical protein